MAHFYRLSSESKDKDFWSCILFFCLETKEQKIQDWIFFAKKLKFLLRKFPDSHGNEVCFLN